MKASGQRSIRADGRRVCVLRSIIHRNSYEKTVRQPAPIAGYEVGKLDSLTQVDNSMAPRNCELSYYEQLSNVDESIAALEPLVGVSLRQ